LAFSLINEAIENELTADDYAKIAKCYLSLGRYWERSDIAELRNAEEFEHGVWLLRLSREVWNKISEKKEFVFVSFMTNALKVHWQVIKEITSPHREMASRGLLSNEATIMSNLIFFTAGNLKESLNKDLFISAHYYDQGECEFELGNIYANDATDNKDNQAFDAADFFYQNALSRFSLLYTKDEVIERYCLRFRGVIYMNLYACWINKHRHGQVETKKQWSDYDILCGKNPKWTCEELAMHYLYTAHSMFEHLYELNPNQYATGLLSVYMMAADRERSIGNFDKAEEFYNSVLKVHEELPQDIDKHSGVNRDKIEALGNLARLYMRPDNFKPDIAVEYYKQASDFCVELSENKLTFFIPTQIKTYIDSTTAFAASGDYETAFDILFDKSFNLMVGLFRSDHPVKFTCWDWWLDVMTTFRQNLVGLTNKNACPTEILSEFVEKAIKAYEYIWVNEVIQVGTAKVDLLISESLRGVNKNGFEERVIETINNNIHTLLSLFQQTQIISLSDKRFYL
jgi:tetratricopeptide (TPR) repeat protein